MRYCLVTGGGVSPDHKDWIATRPGFFLPVRVLSRHLRQLFGQTLQRKSMRADKWGAIHEHEGKAPQPERNTADAGVGNPFDENIHGLARAGKAGFEHDEAYLHAKH